MISWTGVTTLDVLLNLGLFAASIWCVVQLAAALRSRMQ